MEMSDQRYSRAQREALAAAFARPSLSARAVVELAAAGTLTHPSGAPLGPFTTTENTVRSVAHRSRMRREHEARASASRDLPPRDAVERLRRELADAIDREMCRMEIEHAQGRMVCGERLRQVARAIRELAWIPDAADPRPPAPGAKVGGVRLGGETRGGIAGPILRAHLGSARRSSLAA